MRVAILGDTHLGRKLYEYDLTQSIRGILYSFFRTCKDKMVDFAVHLGDVGDKPHWNLAQHKMLTQWLNEFERAEIPIYLLAGNHDVISNPDMVSSLDSIKAGRWEYVHVVDRPTVVEHTHWQHLLIPFPSSGLYRNHAEWEEDVAAAHAEAKDGCVLVYCHLNVVGAVMGEQEWMYRGGEYDLPSAVVAAESTRAVFCGHIHKPQTVKIAGRQKRCSVYLPGAAERLRFDEADDPRRMLLVTDKRMKLRVGTIPIDASTLCTIEVDASGWTNDGDPPTTDDVLSECQLQDYVEIVKVQPLVDEHTTVDWERVEAELYEIGAQHVVMMPPIEIHREEKQIDQEKLEDPLQAAQQFICTRIKDDAERAVLLAQFKALLEKVEQCRDN